MTGWDSGRRSRVWALANPETLEMLRMMAEADPGADRKIRVLQEPSTALMMMETGDPVSGGTFYAGEVLVTSCQAEVDGKVGCVVVVGDEPERARAAAILDAILQGPLHGIGALVEELENEEARIEEARRMDWALASPTRVKFETMEDRPYAAPRS